MTTDHGPRTAESLKPLKAVEAAENRSTSSTSSSDFRRSASTIQGCHRRRAQQLRAAGHGVPVRMLGEVLRGLVAAEGWRRQSRDTGQAAEAFDAALAAVCPRLAGRVRLLTLRDGRLYLDCPSAAHLSELRTFHSARLLAELRRRLPGIRIERLVAKPKGGSGRAV